MPIKTVIDARVPVKIWSDRDSVEDVAIQQLSNTAKLPFVFKHVAVMPDVHLGKGATVGSVIATQGAICPAAVGVDIGCGMMAVKTTLAQKVVEDNISSIRGLIEDLIPTGFEQNEKASERVASWEGWSTQSERVTKNSTKAKLQLGSLGGGNHFIEICLDKAKNVWIMLHSGSRNVGKRMADYHINEAKSLMKKMFISLEDPDLAYLVTKTPEFDQYMEDLHWCQSYAAQNRKEMMQTVLGILSGQCNGRVPLERAMEINCHHNYVAMEHHFGKNVYITRKGAVRARVKDLGIIPGSMGTRSYIVRGLGNSESFHSCSHGAGRRMSRRAALKQFKVEDLVSQTAGVDCRKDIGVLDEIPGAYKDIDQVMDNQKDLVEVVATLKQIMCVKG